jgi:hypothetical protein
MNDKIVFDDRILRDNMRTTSAASHPELVTGELAMPPRQYISATAMHRSIVYDRRRAFGGTLAIVAIAVLLSGLALRSGATADDVERQKFARTCMQWHVAASAVVSRLVQSTRDVDLVYVGNSIDQMRRARRNCELGEVEQACQDYHSVASGMPGYAMTNDLFPCARVVAAER